MFVEGQRKTHMWECKECHQLIPDEETVAYRFVNGVLYGWCRPCFTQRNDRNSQPASSRGETQPVLAH